MKNNWLIKGARVLDPANSFDAVRDLSVQNGTIADIGEALALDNVPVIDARGLVLAPGFVDLHCHLREPGFEYKETIATGTRAAVCGGFTTVCSMANTDPVVDTPATVEFILEQARNAAAARVYPLGRSNPGIRRHATCGDGSVGRSRRRSLFRRWLAGRRCPHHAARAGIQPARG